MEPLSTYWNSVKSSAAAQRPQSSGTGGMGRAWDDLTGLMARWERRLEREGLGVLSPHDRGVPELGRHDQASAAERGRSQITMYPRNMQVRARGVVFQLDQIESTKRGPDWGQMASLRSMSDLSAAIDRMLAALHRFPFEHRKDRRIVELLTQAVPWHRIVKKVHCSKRRIVRVSREVLSWRDPESEAA